MGHARTTLRTSTVGIVSATLVAGTVIGLAPPAGAATPTVRFVDITTADGITLTTPRP